MHILNQHRRILRMMLITNLFIQKCVFRFVCTFTQFLSFPLAFSSIFCRRVPQIFTAFSISIFVHQLTFKEHNRLLWPNFHYILKYNFIGFRFLLWLRRHWKYWCSHPFLIHHFLFIAVAVHVIFLLITFADWENRFQMKEKNIDKRFEIQMELIVM